MEVDPTACDRVDDLMWADPDTKWVADNSPLDLDALMTAPELVERFGLAKHDIQNWSRRYPDSIPVMGKKGNKNLYRVRDVLRYRASQS